MYSINQVRVCLLHFFAFSVFPPPSPFFLYLWYRTWWFSYCSRLLRERGVLVSGMFVVSRKILAVVGVSFGVKSVRVGTLGGTRFFIILRLLLHHIASCCMIRGIVSYDTSHRIVGHVISCRMYDISYPIGMCSISISCGMCDVSYTLSHV